MKRHNTKAFTGGKGTREKENKERIKEKKEKKRLEIP
jgi:hypothetical protein